MTATTSTATLDHLPLVAILRGITPEEIDGAFDALVDAGFEMIEVPLNSPRPFESIKRIAERCPSNVIVGAGTVLDAESVDRLADTGAQLLVTPNYDVDVVTAGQRHNLISLIGCLTPSEAFGAIKHGASAVKLFPAARMGTRYLKDLKSVLPKSTKVMAVGGIDLNNMDEWIYAGIQGFGLGSSLYTPGTDDKTLGKRAKEFVKQWKHLTVTK